MLPLVDIHCHLLSGLDDGPGTMDDAVAMCRMASELGTRHVAAVAHQNEDRPDVTPDRIRQATKALVTRLREARIPLTVYPSAEVMVHAEIDVAWQAGTLLTLADRGRYLLIELPHNLYLDLRDLVQTLVDMGVRPILAHPERQPELLHAAGEIEGLIGAGCLVQVNARSVTRPETRNDRYALRRWFRRGVVHLIGSDGHSLHQRPPTIADAYHQISNWCGQTVADRVCSTNGLAVLNDLPLTVPAPERRRRPWFAGLWHSAHP